MFFVGISAHIFIYLLVPAFLIVCFHCRGIQGNPEVEVLLPAVAFYEYTTPRYSADTYIYETECREEVRHKTPAYDWDEIPSSIREFFCPTGVDTIQVASLLVLRAPPFQRFF